MNIILIGGSGFIGTKLLDILTLDKNNNIKNLDLVDSVKFPHLSVNTDVTNYNDLYNNMENCDIVILLAAVHKDDEKDINKYYKTNVTGCKNVLSVCTNKSIKHLVFFSSVAVYGSIYEKATVYNDPIPNNHYGKSKLEAENLVLQWAKNEGNIYSIIRPTVVIGAHNKGNFFNLISSIQNKRFLRIGNGQNYKSICFVDNLAQFTKEVLLHKDNAVFNYVDTPNLNTNKILEILSEELQINIPKIQIPLFIGLSLALILNIVFKLIYLKSNITYSRIKKFNSNSVFTPNYEKIKYKPKYTTEEAIRIFAKWCREDHLRK